MVTSTLTTIARTWLLPILGENWFSSLTFPSLSPRLFDPSTGKLTLALSGSDLCTRRAILSSPNDYLRDTYVTPYSYVSRVGFGEVRTLDGTGNNLLRPHWGGVGTSQVRLFAPSYLDGVGVARGTYHELPSPRAISNALLTTQEETPLSRHSVLLMAWGQFIDHDLVLSAEGHGEFWPIIVPTGDKHFDPDRTGEQIIPFARLAYAEGTGQDGVPRASVNQITPFIDASMVYGSTPEHAQTLRTPDETGRLLVSYADNGEVILPVHADLAHVAGDVRAHENPILASLHSLFVAEHNRIAGTLLESYQNRNWAVRSLVHRTLWGNAHVDSLGDAVYELSRKVVGAQVQAVTYGEFLPYLLGDRALSEYTGYKTHVNPAISEEFSNAAFRLGHSMVRGSIGVKHEGAATTYEPLMSNFFDPTLLAQEGKSALLAGAIEMPMNPVDLEITGALQNMLFGANLDLGAINIQRGRDTGLPTYAAAREALGYQEVDEFADITGVAATQNALAQVYASPADVDLWVGILAEDKLTGSQLGVVGSAIVADQFTRARDGDRFYYEHDPVVARLDRVLGLSLDTLRLEDIIEANTNLDVHDVFVAGAVDFV